MGDIIGLLLMTILVVGTFTSIRFCVRWFRSVRGAAAAPPAPEQSPSPLPRVQVRVVQREPEPLPEPEIIEIVDALPSSSSRALVRRV